MTRTVCGLQPHRAALVLLTAFLLTACGGGGDSAPPTSSVEEPSDPQTPSAPPGNPGEGNQAPQISGSAPTTAVVGQSYVFQPQASDPDGDKLSFTISNKPAWASFDSSSGQLSGTPTAAHVGQYANIEIAVTDGKVVTPLPRFTITVTAASAGGGGGAVGSTSVTLAWDPPTQNTDGSPLTDLQGYKIHYGNASRSYSESIVIDNAGITRYVVDSLEPGTYYFAVTAFNSKGTESEYSMEVSATLN